MAAQRAKGTSIPDPFELTDQTLEWLATRYPQVDPELARERFEAWACEYLYANWQKTFQNFVMRESDAGKLGPLMRKAAPKTDEMGALIADAFRVGFRKPIGTETAEQFRAALEAHKAKRASGVVSLLRGTA